MSENKPRFHVEQSEKSKLNVPRETFPIKDRTCPICGESRFTKSFDVNDHSISGEKFSIVVCNKCRLHITHPLPQNLGKYYESEEYISHTETRKGIVNKIYHLVQKENLSRKFVNANNHAPQGKWMDYGCGAGAFLNYLKSKGIPSRGFEPDNKARAVAKQKNLEVNDILDYPATQEMFACITMWHVLEHIPNMQEIVHLHYSKLKENGILVIAVPNHESFDAKRYKSHWAAYDVPRHLWHFTEADITRLAEKNNFKLERTYPMKFDSYYVSMLSEKYRKGTLLNGVATGFLSNLFARISGYPYSSQVYVLRKKGL